MLKVFAGSVNHELVASLNRAGALAVGLSGIDALLVGGGADGPGAGRGGPRDPRPIRRCCDLLTAQRLSCRWWPAWRATGTAQVYNVNADQMAVACAAAFGAEQLIFLTDVDGVLDGAKQVRPLLTAADSAQLDRRRRRHRRHAGQTECRLGSAARRGATGADRAGRRGRSARHGFGRRSRSVPGWCSRRCNAHDQRSHGGCFRGIRGTRRRGSTVRKAVMRDIAPILDLINGYAAKGIMLPRTEFELSEAIRDFTVVLRGDELLGCGALHFYSPTIGEIRSLAVHENAKTHGVGRRVVEALVQRGRSNTNWMPSSPSLTLWTSSTKSDFTWWSAAFCR